MLLQFEYINTQGGFVTELDGVLIKGDNFSVSRVFDLIVVFVNCEVCNVGEFKIRFDISKKGKAEKCSYCGEWGVVNIRED